MACFGLHVVEQLFYLIPVQIEAIPKIQHFRIGKVAMFNLSIDLVPGLKPRLLVGLWKSNPFEHERNFDQSFDKRPVPNRAERDQFLLNGRGAQLASTDAVGF